MRPYSPRFDEHYWSASGGADEKTHVFLHGNDLPRRFAGAGAFTVAELGFGTGLNFLLTVELWQRAAPTASRLTYIGYEQFPLSAAELATLHAVFPPSLHALAQTLRAAWPPAPGWSAHAFGAVTLHLFNGDAAAGLPTQPQKANAWFLDGFSPAKNPQLWQPALLAQVAAHTAPGGTFATYAAARLVKNSLAAAGFHQRRVAGFPPKRHMLVGGLG